MASFMTQVKRGNAHRWTLNPLNLGACLSCFLTKYLNRFSFAVLTMGLMDIVPPGVVTGDNLMKLMEYCRDNAVSF